MLRYLYADELRSHKKLARTMFEDRAGQFRDRLGWPVMVEDGQERDQYDAQGPLYVIWQQPDGSHGGSMRFMPTTGPCMVNEHFTDILGGGTIESPLIWECTRFCVSPRVLDPGRISAALMLGGAELGLRFHLRHAVGVFDARMVRVYRRLGWEPDLLGKAEGIGVGLWEFSAEVRNRMLRRAGLSRSLSGLWLNRGFGAREPQSAVA